jgi:hypothetical protein
VSLNIIYVVLSESQLSRPAAILGQSTSIKQANSVFRALWSERHAGSIYKLPESPGALSRANVRQRARRNAAYCGTRFNTAELRSSPAMMR